MSLDELQRIKKWHLAHRRDHPVECHLWDAVLTLWVAGWVGWLPGCAFHEFWTVPACVFAMFAPSLYVAARVRAHRAGRLRCDWLRAI